MPLTIYLISTISNLTGNLVALIIGLLYCYRRSSPPYLRIFPVYLFVSLAVEVIAGAFIGKVFHFSIFGDHQPYAKKVIYNLYTLFELYVFAWFLFQVLRSSLIRRLLIALVILFSIYFIFYLLQTDIGKKNNMSLIVLESLIIIIPCLTFYRELFTGKEPIDLLKTPSFWLVTGIFFYLATIIPLCAATDYMFSHGLTKAVRNLASINSFALVVTYLLFIKGFTCRIKKS